MAISPKSGALASGRDQGFTPSYSRPHADFRWVPWRHKHVVGAGVVDGCRGSLLRSRALGPGQGATKWPTSQSQKLWAPALSS